MGAAKRSALRAGRGLKGDVSLGANSSCNNYQSLIIFIPADIFTILTSFGDLC